MTLNNKRIEYKSGSVNSFWPDISFLDVCICALLICFLFGSASVPANAFAGEKAWVGAQVQPLAGAMKRFLSRLTGTEEGVLVAAVTKAGPAEQMGIKPNDVVLEL